MSHGEDTTNTDDTWIANRLLRDAGLATEQVTLTHVAGGGNNRVFRVDTADGPAAILKRYFRHPEDPRDRLAHEFGFSMFAWARGIRCLPEPVAKDDDAGAALYRFVPGRMLEPEEVTPSRVNEALDFFRQLNAHRDHAEAAALPAGSEACFCDLEHVAVVDRRVRGLDAVGDPGAAAFVERELKPYWASVHPKIARAETATTPSPRCLSPSDFGFHNALRRDDDGTLVFHDFEYAGWDDPAKLLGDFFHQPRRPAPWACYAAFEDAVIETLNLDDAQRSRFRRLLPVYRVKWCGIILAPLLPGAAERRRYAGVEVDPSVIVQRAAALLHQPLATSH